MVDGFTSAPGPPRFEGRAPLGRPGSETPDEIPSTSDRRDRDHRTGRGRPGCDPASRGRGGASLQPDPGLGGPSAGVRDPGWRAGARGGVPGHRRRQQRHPCLRHQRLRRVARLRRGTHEGRGLPRHPPAVRVPCVRRSRRLRARADGTRPGDVRRGHRLLGHLAVGARRRDRSRHACRPRPGSGQHLHQRLRGGGLGGLPRGQHRAHPAWHLHLRGQGRASRGPRRLRHPVLQPGRCRQRRSRWASRP